MKLTVKDKELTRQIEKCTTLKIGGKGLKRGNTQMGEQEHPGKGTPMESN